jgi:predicted dehydrogenase
MNNHPISRRDFLGRTAIAGAGISLTGTNLLRAKEAPPAPARKIGANDRITLAVIGTNSRGLSHIESLGGIPGVEITYICDVEDGAMAKGLKETAKWQKNVPKGLRDFREALADQSLDAVTIATPDHWHTPMAILALAAGKHVYLEKPCSHNPHEGELLIQAVAKSGRVFQMGNQRRSFPNVQEVIKQIHGGLIGRAYFARAWYANDRKSIGIGKLAPVPGTLDYELWQGPAPRQPYQDNLIPYNWHWFWNWGTGEALNNGTHEVDVCRWALNVGFPSHVSSIGGRYAFKDDWQTPDTQVIGWDFPEGASISWEGRSCNGFQDEKLTRGLVVHGTEGSVLIDANSYMHYDARHKLVKQVKNMGEQADGTNTFSANGSSLDRLHVANFIDAIRGSQPANSPVEVAHTSVTLLHLGNIAWRVGRELNCDPSNGHILEDKKAAGLWRREYQKGWEPKV